MPAVNCYLSQEALENIRAKARNFNLSVSCVIRKAVENYLELEDQKKARKRVLKVLTKKKPLGGTTAWEEIHQERIQADVNRG